jgi:chromatin remodeling complex protein RSC6
MSGTISRRTSCRRDEKKRTLINADDALKVVSGGKKQVSMFEMTKLVSGHVK